MRIALILASMLALSATAQAQAVNCSHPQSSGQRLICDNPDLLGWSRRINGHYLRVTVMAEPPDYFRLKRGQKPYLAARDACGSVACLMRVFKKRHSELNDIAYE